MFILEVSIKGTDAVRNVFRKAFLGNNNTAQAELREDTDEDRFVGFTRPGGIGDIFDKYFPPAKSEEPPRGGIFEGLGDIIFGRKKPSIEDIFNKHFPKPSTEKIMEGLEDMKETLGYITKKQKYEGNVSGELLDKVKADLLKTLQGITSGLNPGIGERMKAELSEAFDAAKQGDFSKLSAFLKKIKGLSKDLKEMPKPDDYHIVPCKEPMNIAL